MHRLCVSEQHKIRKKKVFFSSLLECYFKHVKHFKDRSLQEKIFCSSRKYKIYKNLYKRNKVFFQSCYRMFPHLFLRRITYTLNVFVRFSKKKIFMQFSKKKTTVLQFQKFIKSKQRKCLSSAFTQCCYNIYLKKKAYTLNFYYLI